LIIDFGVGEPLAVCGTDGAARRDGGATRPQQAEAVPGKDAGAEMKVVGDALTACATGDRLDEHAAQLGLDGSARFKREKQARYEERFWRHVQVLLHKMPQCLGELCGALDEGV